MTDGSATTTEVPTAYAVLEHLVGSLVEDRDAVRIDVSDGPVAAAR